MLPTKREHLFVIRLHVNILFLGPFYLQCKPHSRFLGYKIDSFMVASLAGLFEKRKRAFATDGIAPSDHDAKYRLTQQSSRLP